MKLCFFADYEQLQLILGGVKFIFRLGNIFSSQGSLLNHTSKLCIR